MEKDIHVKLWSFLFVFNLPHDLSGFFLSVCAELPLKSASVDAVVCDLPFGRKFGTKMDIAVNLPLILTEMER